MPDSLAGDLKRHIYETYGNYDIRANGPRYDSHWVMSLEWLNEIRRMEDSTGAVFTPGLQVSAPHWLLGIPVEVREDAGAPRLEPNSAPGHA